jgi:hypothetical protein
MTPNFALLALMVVSAGCQIEGEPATAGPSLAATIQAAQARMHERFRSAQRIEQAITHSDLDRARTEARALAQLTEPEIVPRWRPYLERIAPAAHQIDRAADVVAAANATAALGRECARCHEAMAAKITFPLQPRPMEDARLAPQMLGHQWAAARMWEGLIGPANDRWLEGAQALAQVPLTIVAEEPMTASRKSPMRADGDMIGDDVARVRLYANRAVAARNGDARAEIFGELLATCAHCHAVIRDR